MFEREIIRQLSVWKTDKNRKPLVIYSLPPILIQKTIKYTPTLIQKQTKFTPTLKLFRIFVSHYK